MKTINETHCRACGSTDPEDVGSFVLQETEGYSACCNKSTRSNGSYTDYMGRKVVERCSEEAGCRHD